MHLDSRRQHLLLLACNAQPMDDIWSPLNHLQEACSKEVTMAIYVIEVTDFKSEVRFDLQGCLVDVVVVTLEAANRDHDYVGIWGH